MLIRDNYLEKHEHTCRLPQLIKQVGFYTVQVFYFPVEGTFL